MSESKMTLGHAVPAKSNTPRPKLVTRVWKWFVGTWRPLVMLLFDLRLNRMLGHWLVIVTHIGRRSGRTRRTPLYVQHYDLTTREVMVVAAFGNTDWYRNICAAPAVEIQIGRERYAPDQRILQVEEIAEVERRFRRSHPIVARAQCWLMGWSWGCAEAEFLQWAGTLRGVIFRPKKLRDSDGPKVADDVPAAK